MGYSVIPMNQRGLLPALLLFVASTLHAQINGVSAELKLDSEEYLPGEALQLMVRVMNRSGQVVSFGADQNWLTISMTTDKGSPCPKLDDMPVQGEFSLQSGEAGTKTVNPTPYYDFRTIGRYRVSATVRIPQWGQEITCKPVSFTIGSGVPILNLANLQIGVPLAPGATNKVPEMRSYTLLKVSSLKEVKLYFKLADSRGKTLRVFPIARMTSFSEPEGQIDRYNNLHVLHQIGARTFNYCVLSPEGRWVARQTYLYAGSRPVLRMTEDGLIRVVGGARKLSENDYPPAPESARQ
jgi:hypothetical protein